MERRRCGSGSGVASANTIPVHLHVHTNNAAGIILTGMQVVRTTHGDRGGKEMEKVEEKATEERELGMGGPVAAA